MTGCLTHDLLAHRLAAGKKDIIEFLVQQALVLLPAPVDHADIFPGKGRLDELRHHPAGGRGIGTGLDHSGIAGGQSIHQGIDGKQKGIVPRAHDQRHAVGRRLYAAARSKLRQRGMHGLFPGKSSDMAQHIADLAQYQSGFAHIAFRPALAQILFQRCGNVRLMIADDLFQCPEGLHPVIQR